MAENISFFGASLHVVASRTFPSGFSVSSFADDADPFDSPAIQTADKGMGPNGDLVVWQKPAIVEFSVSVIPESDDDKNLAILLEANRMAKKKGRTAMDNVSVSAVYQSGKIVNFSQGMITGGPPISGGASSGRLKSKTYTFCFEDRNEVNPS